MNNKVFTKMTKEINEKINNELRDIVLSNIQLDSVPNLDIVNEYICKVDSDSLMNVCHVAEVLGWEVIGKIIRIAVEKYKDKN